jgi:hypothetical protein
MAAETDFISSANQSEKVRIFLDKCNLSQYFSIFSEQGYDDLDQIVQITKKVEEIESFLKDVGLDTKPGHKRRFIAAVQIEASKTDHGLGSSKDAGGKQGTTEKKGRVDPSKCMYI